MRNWTRRAAGDSLSWISARGYFELKRRQSWEQLLFVMNFSAIRRITAFILGFSVFGTIALAQQRPLLTEDPRLIAEGSVVSELGFGYQHRARFPVSGLTGDLYAIL